METATVATAIIGVRGGPLTPIRKCGVYCKKNKGCVGVARVPQYQRRAPEDLAGEQPALQPEGEGHVD